MVSTRPETTEQTSLPDELQARRRVLLQELKDRSLWFVRVRWWVPPTVAAGLLVARLVGIHMATLPLLGVALFVLGCNTIFLRWHKRFVHETALQTEQHLRRFTHWQVAADYAAMFTFIHFTGGASSPFVFFLIFHVIFTSILLRHQVAHLFAVGVALALGCLAAAESFGWLPPRPMLLGGQPLGLIQRPLPALVQWGIFSAAVLMSCYATTNIMEMVRRRILRLADLSETVIVLNNRLGSLHAISQSIVSLRRLEPVLQIACQELAAVMGVQGVSVKLLSEDGQRLVYASACGLPPQFAVGWEVEVARSPLNRRLIEGEPFVTGSVTQRELFQLGEELSAAHLQSVLFVPLRVGGKVTGVLGAYGTLQDQFHQNEIQFFTLAGELVGLAIENARAYQAIEEFTQERDRFLRRAAHNLRAPLAAMLAILEVVRDGYLGDLNEAQSDYIRRLEHRARGLMSLINELLLLAERQVRLRHAEGDRVNMVDITRRVGRTFQDEAQQRKLELTVRVDGEPPIVLGDGALLERMLENLVSNSIKYTRAGGRIVIAVGVAEGQKLSLTVSDTGIGIPAEAMPRLFTEFFRADNAKALEDIGTGLGLTIVKEIAELHSGKVAVQSCENEGTTFTVLLPAAPPLSPPPDDSRDGPSAESPASPA